MIYFSAAHLQFSSLNEIGSILIYKFEKLIFIKTRSTLRPKMTKCFFKKLLMFIRKGQYLLNNK